MDWFKRLWSGMKDPPRRRRYFRGVEVVLIVLFPWIGWCPFLALWLVDLLLYARENRGSNMRFVYLLLALVPLGLLLGKLVIWLVAHGGR